MALWLLYISSLLCFKAVHGRPRHAGETTGARNTTKLQYTLQHITFSRLKNGLRESPIMRIPMNTHTKWLIRTCTDLTGEAQPEAAHKTPALFIHGQHLFVCVTASGGNKMPVTRGNSGRRNTSVFATYDNSEVPFTGKIRRLLWVECFRELQANAPPKNWKIKGGQKFQAFFSRIDTEATVV